jgi:uncharacterized integral membrane protein (TIGR00698 family)
MSMTFMTFLESLPGRSWLDRALDLLPGLLLTIMLAALAFMLHGLPLLGVFSPMILAILIGMVFHNVIGTPERAHAGVAFAMRCLLRLGIILLGLQLTTAQVAAVGVDGAAIIVAVLAATFCFTKAVGRWLGVDPKLAELIAAGTSVCGASAVLATNTVTRGRDEDVAYAVACVTLFGSIAMFLYPLLGTALQLTARDYGLWTGASIHEIAQVVAAAFQHGEEAGRSGTIAKLTRVMMLAPMIFALGWMAMRRAPQQSQEGGLLPMPWFILGFLALVGLNSFVIIDAGIRVGIAQVTTFLLTTALAGMGLGADFKKLVAAGSRPLLLGAVATLFISVLSLALVVLVY